MTSRLGRATQGVRLIDMEDGDGAVSLARLEEQDDRNRRRTRARRKREATPHG